MLATQIMQPSRRSFLAAIGTALAATPALSRSGAPRASAMRGLIPAGDLMIDRGIVHLQTGTLGLTPRPVLDATAAAAREIERDPLIAAYGPGKVRLDGVRAAIGRLVGCSTEELVLTSSTTTGMNMVAQGLRLAPGDEVLTTDQEHGGGYLCWDWLAQYQGVAVNKIPVPPGEGDGGAIVERFRRAITRRTKVLSFSHILYSTGLKLPVAALAALAREHGCICVVDGAQAAGSAPLDVKALGCHAYAGSGHKWLLGPKGTGFLYLAAELGDAIAPMPLQDGRQVNAEGSGVANIAGFYGLAAAAAYLETIGLGQIERHNLALTRELRDALASLARVSFAAPRDGPLASQLLTFRFAGRDQKALRAALANSKVHIRAVKQGEYTGLRASPHLYNDRADNEALVEALKQALA